MVSNLRLIILNRSNYHHQLFNNIFCFLLDKRRIEGLEGTNPYDLLFAALSSDNKTTLGRFATVAEKDQQKTILDGDAIVQLDKALTGNLINRDDEERRLSNFKRHGRGISSLASNIDSSSKLIGVGNTGVIVDQDHEIKEKKMVEKDLDMGKAGSTTKLQKIAFKWDGYTSTESEQKIRFKCGVVFEGKDVFAGISFLSNGPLPDFVRDAPMSNSAVIDVKKM